MFHLVMNKYHQWIHLGIPVGMGVGRAVAPSYTPAFHNIYEFPNSEIMGWAVAPLHTGFQ